MDNEITDQEHDDVLLVFIHLEQPIRLQEEVCDEVTAS